MDSRAIACCFVIIHAVRYTLQTNTTDTATRSSGEVKGGAMRHLLWSHVINPLSTSKSALVFEVR